MGTLVVSLDAELAWGFHDREPPAGRLSDARDAWRELLDLFDSYDVPATWAVVGHLFTEECAGGHAGHPAGETVCQRPVSGGAAAETLPPERAWFGDGLVDAVESAAVDHEIAAHGFTHVHFDHEAMSRPAARRELERTVDVARERGLEPASFVFPVNEVRYLRLLDQCGFDSYRGRAPVSYASDFTRRVRKAAAAVGGVGTPPIVHPHVDEYGLVNVPASMSLFDDLGPLRPVVEPFHGDPVLARALRGLQAVTGTDGVLHLWLHPHDVTSAADLGRVRAVLSAADSLREDGELTIETISDVAAGVREASS